VLWMWRMVGMGGKLLWLKTVRIQAREYKRA
jgi:hypothetical protein